MTKKPLLAVFAAGLALTATACSSDPEPAAAAATTEAATTDPIIGEWTMTSLEVGTEGALEEIPYSGQVIFTEAGTMAVQAANPDTTAPDTAFTLGGYEAYYGPVEIDADAGSFEIEVASAAARGVVGQRLTRNYEVTGDTLVLTPTDPADGFRATYERAGD